MVTVKIWFENGDFSEHAEDEAFLRRYEELRAEGLAGKALVHALVSDDWGAPPRTVQLWRGDVLVASIPYA